MPGTIPPMQEQFGRIQQHTIIVMSATTAAAADPPAAEPFNSNSSQSTTTSSSSHGGEGDAPGGVESAERAISLLAVNKKERAERRKEGQREADGGGWWGRTRVHRLSFLGLIRLFQLFMVVYVAVPLGLLYDNGAICPYRVLCARGPAELSLLAVSKGCALLMYAPLTVIILSKCATLLSFVHSTYLVMMMDLHGLHEMHVDLGTELAVYAALHVIGHVIRISLHDVSLFTAKEPTICTGYVITGLILILVPPMLFDTIKRHVSFERRKCLHLLAVPFLVALSYHQVRLGWFCRLLLVVYGADKVYTNCTKAYHVDVPYLWAIGKGTLVEFKPPPGFTFKSGQYIFVCAPYISRFEWHPFSIIPSTMSDGSLGCEFYAQACGDWTHKLLQAAKHGVRRPLWISGSRPSPFDASVSYGYLFLICTGIGITPGISVISRYYCSKVIVLVWVCRDEHLISLYGKELQVVNSKVFYTGSHESGAVKQGVDGNVLYCCTDGRRPDIRSEIERVVIHKRSLQSSCPEAGGGRGLAGSESSPIKMAASCDQYTGMARKSSISTSRDRSDSVVTDPQSRLEWAGSHDSSTHLGTFSPSPSPSSSTTITQHHYHQHQHHHYSSSPQQSQQPFRRAMMELYHVDRQEEVDSSEWAVLYCGASAALGESLSKYCREHGIFFKTEFFGSW